MPIISLFILAILLVPVIALIVQFATRPIATIGAVLRFVWIAVRTVLFVVAAITWVVYIWIYASGGGEGQNPFADGLNILIFTVPWLATFIPDIIARKRRERTVTDKTGEQSESDDLLA